MLKLFGNKSSSVERITTILNGNTAKGRQEILNSLNQFHDPLNVYPDFRGGNLILTVGKSISKIAGTVDSKITRKIEDKYFAPAGLICKIEIGKSYKIIKNKAGLFECEVVLTITPTK